MNATCPDCVSKNFCEEFLEETTSLLESGRVSQEREPQRENDLRSRVEVAESRGAEEEGRKAVGGHRVREGSHLRC